MEQNVYVILATTYPAWQYAQLAHKKAVYSVIRQQFAPFVTTLLTTWMVLNAHKFVEMVNSSTYNVTMEMCWMAMDVRQIVKLKMTTHVVGVHQSVLQVVHIQAR